MAFSIATNNGAARTGTLTVAGRTVTVNQGAAATPCSYAVSPTTFSIGASGSTNSSSNVTTSKDCAWTAAASDAWISITAGSSGSGNGKVTFNVAANTSTSSRTGTLTVAGQSVSIAQAAAAPCSYSVSPTSASVGLAGGTGTVSVTSTSGCSWTAGSNANWITIVTGSSGTASGTVSYAVLPNTGSARSGTMTVAGQTVTIISIPIQLWIQATRTFWLGPVFGLDFVNVGGNEGQAFPFGFGIGSDIAPNADLRAWFLFPDISADQAARTFGAGVAFEIRFG